MEVIYKPNKTSSSEPTAALRWLAETNPFDMTTTRTLQQGWTIVEYNENGVPMSAHTEWRDVPTVVE